MSGRPFAYRRTADGSFVLYSVGANGMDDRGQPCPRKLNGRGEPEAGFHLDQNDWVWSGTRRSTAHQP